jgi:hypothetical protein
MGKKCTTMQPSEKSHKAGCATRQASASRARKRDWTTRCGNITYADNPQRPHGLPQAASVLPKQGMVAPPATSRTSAR